ncbi:MAG: serine hydrolase, partial [Balneolaceae bacterium]
MGVLLTAGCSTEPQTLDELKTSVEEYLAGEEGEFAVWFQDLNEPERSFGINEHTVFHAASTMKTPVMIEIYKRAAQGEFSVRDSITIKNEFTSIVDGSPYSIDLQPDSNDPIEHQIGEQTTIYDLMHAMITYSSNVATNMMIELVGAEETTQSMRELGADDILVLRGVYDMKAFERELSNRTTARDLGIILKAIADGEILGEEAHDEMMDILKDQFYRDVIPRFLPDEAVTATKSGSISGVEHDSGIVMLPDGQRYVLVFLSRNLPDDDYGRVIGGTVSKMVYD